jgi:hypothetical protein
MWGGDALLLLTKYDVIPFALPYKKPVMAAGPTMVRLLSNSNIESASIVPVLWK